MTTTAKIGGRRGWRMSGGDHQINTSKLLVCAGAVLALTQAAPVPEPTSRMQADVDRLAARALQLDRLWPWTVADQEIDRVARHGKAVAPLLVAFLAEDPHEPPEDMADLRVQQQAALALCRIYKVSEQCGHVYCNRETREGNKAVRRFWVEKTSQDAKRLQDKHETWRHLHRRGGHDSSAGVARSLNPVKAQEWVLARLKGQGIVLRAVA
jgi:hypothetical protein